MQCDTEKAMNGDLHHGNVHIEERVDDVSSHYSHSTAVDAFLPLANGLNSSAVNSENNGNLTENGDLNCNGVGSKDEQSSKKSRRVTFPDNENVVQSYLNPPDPWKHGKSCTTEILLQAYHKACERFNVKPNSKLLNQLYVITNFVERNDTLSLRGICHVYYLLYCMYALYVIRLLLRIARHFMHRIISVCVICLQVRR